MNDFAITLKAESPLAIRADHASGGADTARYISGTAFAGSLAAVHRLLHRDSEREFEDLFLRGLVQYPNLYPALFDEGSKPHNHWQDDSLPVYPLPKTAQSCKRYPGFLYHPSEKDSGHGVRDTLLDWAVFALSQQGEVRARTQGVNGLTPKDAIALDAIRRHKNCVYAVTDAAGKVNQCSEPMTHFDSYYRQSKTEPNGLLKAETHTRLQTHTGINREAGTVEDGVLYNRQVFEEDMRFWGLLKVDDELTSPLERFIDEIGQSGLVRVGTGRTRGLGKVTLALQPMEGAQHDLHACEQRLRAFHDALVTQARAYDLSNVCPFYFALTLHSPVILTDYALRYYSTIPSGKLAKMVGVPEGTFELLYQDAGVQRVTGWNELWGLPRTNEYVIETGSVFLYACTEELNESLAQGLFALEEQGIGRRCAEGFGRVCLSDPFHREGQPR